MEQATATEGRSDPRRAQRRELLRALILYLAMGVVLLAGAWRDFGNIGGKDWSGCLGQTQAELTSLLDYGQFPAWNPWRTGGQVSFAQAQSMFLSPVTPVALFTGANAAFKLWLLPLFVIGAMGMYVLAGRLGLRGVARLVPGAVFFGASVFPLYVTGGVPNWLFGMAILPWLFVAHRKSMWDHRFVVAAAAAYAGVLWCGSIHHFIYFPLLFGLDAVVLAVQRRSLRPLLTTAAWGLVGVALAAVRVVPMLELFREFPRALSGRGAWVPLPLLPRLLFGTELPDLRGGSGGLFVFEGSAVYWINCGAFIGWAAGLLALLAVLSSPRRSAGLLLSAVFFIWMALGSGVEPSLWDLMHRLPVLRSMHSPERLMLLVVFALALLAGFGFAVVEEAGRRWSSARATLARLLSMRVLTGALFAAVVLPLLAVNRSIVDTAFTVPPPAGLEPTTLLAQGTPRPPFKQERAVGHSQLWMERLYEAVLRNVGNPDAESDIPTPRAVKVEGEPDYRGECHLVGGHGSVSAEITPNRIHVTAELTAADRLVVNQLFFPGWRATGTVERACEAHEELLSLPLGAGRHDLVLEFAPRSIPLGFQLEGIALAILLLWGLMCKVVAPQPITAGGILLRSDAFALAAMGTVVVAIGAWYVLSPTAALATPPPDWRAKAITVAAQDDLQAALDAAPPGAVIRVTPGVHAGARLRRGVTLVADPIGSVELGEAAIEELPADEVAAVLGFRFGSPGRLTIGRCAGTVILQSCEWVEPERSLLAEGAEHLLVIACRLPDVEAANSRVVLVRCDLATGRLSATDSLLLLQETRVQSAPDRAAIHLDRSQLRLSSGAEVPSLELQNGSTALISAADLGPVPPRCDADSSVTLADPRLPSISFSSNLQVSSEIDATITGPPGAKGLLMLSAAPILFPLTGRNAGQFLQADLNRTNLVITVELPASGRTVLRVPTLAKRFRPGSGLFVQLLMPAGDDPKGKLCSLVDGSLIEPQLEAR